MGLIPTALVLEPSSLVYPIDLALGLVLPFHLHLGMREVIRDYAPNQQFWQYVLLGVSVATALGLTKLNFNGEGVTAGVKQLWKKPASSRD
jgi:succinate dehydrogenase (ubiquinone) membrane anchor subunit